MQTIIYLTLIALLASVGIGMALIITDDKITDNKAIAEPYTEPYNFGTVLELNDSNVNNELSQYPFFVLDCYVTWCEPCKDLTSTLSELSSELKSQVAFGTIDVEENKETKELYNIFSYPAILFFKNGTLVDSQIGYGSKSELVERLQMIKPDLDISNVGANKGRIANIPPPSLTMPLGIPRNISPDKMQIMPAPAPAVFRQFIENTTKYGNSSNFSINDSPY